jgi:hypothetical protein
MTDEWHIEREEKISRKMQKNCKIHSKESKADPRWIWSVEEATKNRYLNDFLKDNS